MTVESGRLPAEGVQRMFDRIAPVYDVMNRVMTAGLDRRWRRITLEATVRGDDRVLDACCGTGDLAIGARRRGADVTGLDFSGAMLERARKKDAAVEWVQGDALADLLARTGFASVRYRLFAGGIVALHLGDVA